MTPTKKLALTLAMLSIGGLARSAATSASPSRQPEESPPSDEAIIMRWSTLSPEPDADLATWHRRNAPQLAAVERAWAALLRRMRGHRPALFDHQCLALASSLEQLDEAGLLPVPDRLIDLYVKRLLTHLHGAARACNMDQLFNVVYRLEEARSALAEVRWLLTRHQALGGSIPAPGTAQIPDR